MVIPLSGHESHRSAFQGFFIYPAGLVACDFTPNGVTISLSWKTLQKSSWYHL